MGAPVCGLRAVRALRWAVLKVPKPTKVIDPLLERLRDAVDQRVDRGCRGRLRCAVSLAILAIISCLFIEISWQGHRGRANYAASVNRVQLYATVHEVSSEGALAPSTA